MNVVFLSPSFPPQFFNFCTALKAEGVTVLGLGDTPWAELKPELQGALTEYFYEPNLMDREAARRALGYLVWKHGRIDRIDSHNEHWLGLEAQLREDFNISGPRPEQLSQWRTKTGMAKLFEAAGIPRPEGLRTSSKEAVQAFAQRHGFPLVFKPDTGVGAAATFRVDTEEELAKALEQPFDASIIQPFITGDIVSFDGLVDAKGNLIFETGHQYSNGIMEVLNGQLDVAYWSLRELPAQLREFGRKTIAHFGIRERFFHAEFFQKKDGSFVALEVNVRPPGGFTTDMINYTGEFDLYALWAKLIAGKDVSDFKFVARHHIASVSRRYTVKYPASHAQILERVGERLVLHREMPQALSGAMGNEFYLLRDTDLDRMLKDVAFIQQR